VGAACALACLVAAAGAAAVPSTGYLIVPGRSIGKVTLGESTGPVIAAIGPPRGRSTSAGPGWLYGALEVVTDYETQIQVVELIVSPRFGATESEAVRYATSSGIHVGSTLGAVEKAYPRARCTIANQGCVLASGTRTTKFWVPIARNELAASARIIEISIE
jgi:hypothetical protein